MKRSTPTSTTPLGEDELACRRDRFQKNRHVGRLRAGFAEIVKKNPKKTKQQPSSSDDLNHVSRGQVKPGAAGGGKHHAL